MDRGDLQNGLAAEAIDCEFFPGGVQSRGPFVDYLHSAGGGPLHASPVNSMMSFPRNDGTRQRIFFHDDGTLAYEFPEGTVATIETGLGSHQIMRGCVLNDRAFVAFSDGKTPGTRPRWWNGAWFDPVGQEGPSSAAGNTWPPLADSGNATASGPGQRQFMTMYQTRGGYYPLPSSSVVNEYAVADNDEYQFISLPIGPDNVIATRIAMTANAGSAFYMPPSLVQAPPASGTWVVPYSASRPGFSDAELAESGVIPHERVVNWPLPPCIGLEAFSGRLVAWGALNMVPKALLSVQGTSYPTPTYPAFTYNYTAGPKNWTFNGGLDYAGDPSGWTTGATGGQITHVPGGSGMSWKVTGTGAATLGELTSNTQIERFDDFPTGKDWRVRVRAKRSSGCVSGRINFKLAGSSTTVQITAAQLTTDWAWYDALWLPAADTTVGDVHLYIDQTLTNAEWIAIDEIHPYDATAPNLNGYLLISNPNDLETFDYTRGILGVRPGDGQAVVNCVDMRGTLYVFKERSLFGVTDNGQDPYLWDPPAIMSDTVGCLSVHGVGRGDGWLVTISESGAFMFSGGQPTKISQEIQPDWATINFAYRHLSWCRVDPDAQRVYIGVPTSGATYVNTLFVCDFVAGSGSMYLQGGLQTDPVMSPGYGRKWSVWTPPAAPGFPCAARIDRDNGQRTFVVGGGTTGSAGYVSARIPADWGGTTDTFGASTPDILATYETATLGQPMERSFFGAVVAKLRGNGGNVAVTLVRPDNTTNARPARVAATAPLHDLEWQIAQIDTQIGLRFTNESGGTFSMKRCAIYYKKAGSSRLRGTA